MGQAPAVLLIRPGARGPGRLAFGVPELLAAGAWIGRHTGAPVELLDLVHESLDRPALARRLDELGPVVLVGVWVDSGFALWSALALGRFLRARAPDVPLGAWGPAAAGLAGDLREVYDRVVPGDGELGLTELVERRLAGEPIEPGVSEARFLDDLDAIPPLPWDWLERSLAVAPPVGGRLRVTLSRANSSFSSDRIEVELARLAQRVDLSRFVVEFDTPALGRDARGLLRRLATSEVMPLGYEARVAVDLEEETIDWLARARFAVTVPLHSGSPTLLRLGWGILAAEDHVARVALLCRRAQQHRLPWTVEVTVGHPGETLQTAVQTRQLAEVLFTAGPASHGWLSVHPFRLRPGSVVHAQRAAWETSYGTVFHQPTWWRERYDRAFRAEHVDPSAVFDHEGRIRWMHDEYGPLVTSIRNRASGVDGHDHPRSRLRRRLQLADAWVLSRTMRDRQLARARDVRVVRTGFPLALDPASPTDRQLESAMRARTDRGRPLDEVVQTALFDAPPAQFLGAVDARAMLEDRIPAPPAEGWAPTTVGLTAWLLALDALRPQPGDRALDLAARSPHAAAVLAELVGGHGEVVAVAPDGATAESLRAALVDRPQVRVLVRGPADRFAVPGRFDVVWLGAALPRVPESLRALLGPEGRAVLAVGPRNEPQDLVLVTPSTERIVGHDQWPVLGGAEGWLPWPRDPQVPPAGVHRADAPARFFAALAAADLGPDSLPGDRLDAPWAKVITEIWPGCEGRSVLPRLGLAHFDVDSLVHALRWPPTALGDRPGRALCAAIATGIESNDSPIGGHGRVPAELLEQIEAYRAELWAPQGLRPPSLVLLDVPALGGQSRAATVAGSWRVATSLAMPADHVLVQVLHEEVALLAEPGEAMRATEAFLLARAPEHVPAFERWRRAKRVRRAS